MSTQLVISALGADRPGIVDELSNIVLTRQLNIEDSRMTVLGGEFAMLLLVSGETSAVDALLEERPRLEEILQMQLMMKTTQSASSETPTLPYEVEVSAMDHPGIVHNLTRFFSQKKINIVNLQTEHYAAPHTGTPMFALHMTVSIPVDTAIAPLREEFAGFCENLNLDAELNRI